MFWRDRWPGQTSHQYSGAQASFWFDNRRGMPDSGESPSCMRSRTTRSSADQQRCSGLGRAANALLTMASIGTCRIVDPGTRARGVDEADPSPSVPGERDHSLV
jgi:hypothetical protein